MMWTRCLAVFLASLAGLPVAALAQDDTSFTYQGELRVDGAPAAGLFDLEACVYAAPGGGSPLGCATPIEDLPVSDGRFTAVLDAGAVFDGSTRYLELRVRAGNETTPHVPLQPRQALRTTPQAQYAARAPFSGLVGVPPSLLDGDDVGVSQVTAGAGLTGGTITSSGTLAIAPGGVTSAMLAPNAVGTAQVDPSQVQLRISGQCAPDEYFRGINPDGTLLCALLPVTFDRVADETLEVGLFVRMVLRPDDRPFLVYHEESFGRLRMRDCADPTCSSGTSRNLVAVGDAGEGIALALRPDGRPLIAYLSDSTDSLSVYSCDDPACTTGTITAIETPVLLGSLDMALRADGRAVIVYRQGGSPYSMRTWHCADVDCTSGVGRSHATTPTGVAIAIRPDGRPILAAGGNGGAADSPRFWDCADANCTTGSLRLTTGVQYQQVHGMLMRSTGRALLLTFSSGGQPSLVSCSDVNCASSQAIQLGVCPTSIAGSLALRPGGNAAVACSYVSAQKHALDFHECGTVTCSGGASRPLLPFGRSGRALAIAVRSDDRPVIAYHDDVNNDVRLYICASPGCP